MKNKLNAAWVKEGTPAKDAGETLC